MPGPEVPRGKTAARARGTETRGTTAVLALATAGLTLLLFLGGPGERAPRSLGHFWDLGHVALFFCGTLLALRAWPALAEMPAGRRWARVLAGAAALGALTEVLQARLSRTPDLDDLWRDLLGSAAALALGSRTLPGVARVPLSGVVALALGAPCLPLARALIDEATARRQFPLLADFEAAGELGRWAGEAQVARSAEVARTGAQSLRVHLGTERYSGVALRHFPGDWRGFRALRFSLYLPEGPPLDLVCRVHDAAHRGRGQAYADRFNRKISVAVGWNDVEIPLAEVRGAPRGRELDLARVEGVGLFAVSLPEPRVVYLDGVRLTR